MLRKITDILEEIEEGLDSLNNKVSVSPSNITTEPNVTTSPSSNISPTKGGFFVYKNFVLTGTLSAMKRQEATKLIRQRGGKVSSSVSKKTDYLICGDKPGSTKYDKALSLGVEILTEQVFVEALGI